VRVSSRCRLYCCAALVAAVVAGRAGGAEPAPGGVLDDAWRFALAITNDAKDLARSQARVAGAWLEAGDPVRALDRAAGISDWRKLAVYADAAAWWAERGQTNESQRPLLEAETLVPGIQDWPHDRVQMHIARAKAMLGRRADLVLLAGVYRENREQQGPIQVALALESARRGDVDAALADLEGIGRQSFLDLDCARASGFREILATGRLPAGRVSNLLARAWSEVSGVPGWRKTDLQFDLVDTIRAAGDLLLARAWLETATAELRAANYPSNVRAAGLAHAAVRWGRLGETGIVAALEREYADGPGKRIELIERPAALASLGEAAALAGDAPRAQRLFAEALDVAAGLLNRRPRALACVEVMLSLARAGIDPKPLEARRRELLAGFEPRGL
jgi:hypothetical protein